LCDWQWKLFVNNYKNIQTQKSVTMEMLSWTTAITNPMIELHVCNTKLLVFPFLAIFIFISLSTTSRSRFCILEKLAPFSRDLMNTHNIHTTLPDEPLQTLTTWSAAATINDVMVSGYYIDEISRWRGNDKKITTRK